MSPPERAWRQTAVHAAPPPPEAAPYLGHHVESVLAIATPLAACVLGHAIVCTVTTKRKSGGIERVGVGGLVGGWGNGLSVVFAAAAVACGGLSRHACVCDGTPRLLLLLQGLPPRQSSHPQPEPTACPATSDTKKAATHKAAQASPHESEGARVRRLPGRSPMVGGAAMPATMGMPIWGVRIAEVASMAECMRF